VPSNRIPTTGPQDSDFRNSPLEYVRVLYVRFIQGLFNAAPPGYYHWEPTEDSEIYISDENPMKAETIGKRPAIAVSRGPAQFHSLGLDDMESYNMQTGQKKKSVLVPGTMTINCCSRADLECDRLAWVVAEQLWANRELLLKLGFFEVGRQPVIGAPSPAGSIVQADAGDEWYVTSVTCPWQFNRTTVVTPLGERILQGIDLAMRTRPAVVRQGGHGEGVDIHACPPPPFSPASDVYGGTPDPTASSPPALPRVPHPMNPAQTVRIRSSKPNSPAVKPPSIGGRTLPISTTPVEESCGNDTDPRGSTSTVKV
jgi:hypothetical protein